MIALIWRSTVWQCAHVAVNSQMVPFFPFKRCGVCKLRTYCGKECQKIDWNANLGNHKGCCGSLVHKNPSHRPWCAYLDRDPELDRDCLVSTGGDQVPSTWADHHRYEHVHICRGENDRRGYRLACVAREYHAWNSHEALLNIQVGICLGIHYPRRRPYGENIGS